MCQYGLTMVSADVKNWLLRATKLPSTQYLHSLEKNTLTKCIMSTQANYPKGVAFLHCILIHDNIYALVISPL